MSFSEKLYQNFIEDDRWLLLVNGLKVTILVTLFALLVGVIIGFTVAIIRSLHDKTGKFKILNAICKVYLTIIRGTPSMIQVLFMYLVVFGASSLNSIVIGGLAFGINSGAYVAEIVRSGIMAIPEGQTEAGRSLGLSYGQTMRLIIMPQAFKNVLPALVNEMIVLIKETAIMKMHIASTRMIGYSATCRICMEESSRSAPKQIAKRRMAAQPAEKPEATNRAGRTAVLMSGKRISAEIRKPV